MYVCLYVCMYVYISSSERSKATQPPRIPWPLILAAMPFYCIMGCSLSLGFKVEGLELLVYLG